MKNILIGIPTTKWQPLRDIIESQSVEIDTSYANMWNYPTEIKGWKDWDNQTREQGLFHSVGSFDLNSDDRIITIIKDPFHVLYDYWYTNWAWNRVQHSTETFSEFVDIYLNRSVVFHVPAFRKSLFSQLKDIEGNWLLDENSILLSYTNLKEDVVQLSKQFNIHIDNYNEFITPNSFERDKFYTNEQITKLSELWADDLDYFSKLFEKKSMYQKSQSASSKNKIAICFSGHIRDLEKTKDYWLELIKRYDIDVYASFWDIENKETGDTINNFHKIYNVKKLEIERYNMFNKSTLEPLRYHINPPTSILSSLMDSCNQFGTMSMWYKIWKANMLTKEFDIDYDVVIRARTDTYFIHPIDIDIDNALSVPNGRIRLNNYPNSDGIADLFAYGSPKMMDYYSTCYFFMMEHLNKGHYMVPHEHFLHTHMNKVQVSIKFMKEGFMISRNWKGIPNEVYCEDIDTNQIILSDFMDLIPNKNIIWTKDIKESFKV